MTAIASTTKAGVVLVHGAFVDGSGWEGVYKILKKDRYEVSVVQIATASLVDDVALTTRTIGAHAGSVILVGHSYAGVVITEAGNNPKVAGLVYVAAFAPDSGESVATITKDPFPDAPVAPLLPPEDGFLMLDKSKFHESFAADLSKDKSAFMADSQVPWGLQAVGGAIGKPAWKSKPSWFLIPSGDRMIPPAAQRLMAKRAGSTVVEVNASHVVQVSQPEAVATLIKSAAQGTKMSSN